MGQKDCSFSILKKPCPRSKFPCNRCGAKIVNAGLQWEVTIPLYKKWYFMDAFLNKNGPASDPTRTVYAARYPQFIDPETSKLSPCKFEGPDAVDGTGLFIEGQTPADFGLWVQDFQWSDFGPPPDGPDVWNFFARSHRAVVDFEQAEVDPLSGELITPGRWRIALRILQVAAGSTANPTEPGELDYLYLNYAVGGGYVSGGVLTEWIAHTVGTYYPPANFNCVIPANTSQRWTRPVPTLPALQNTAYTKATLPAGYDWPGSFDENVPNVGPFYPSGFGSNHDYYAPPYIDVRHVPR
ncbi:MAG: hypothetical protein ABIK07_14780 [Planctomycetota bacterium]